MFCPTCGATTKVLDSRPIAYTTVRRRLCPGCGRVYYTSETEIPYIDGLDLVNEYMRALYKKGNKNDNSNDINCISAHVFADSWLLGS